MMIKKYFGFFISLVIGIALFEYANVMHQDCAGANNVIFNIVLGMGNGMSGWNGIVFPILAALPMSILYVREYKTGFLKIRLLKQNVWSYIIRMLLKNALLGGFALAIPLGIFSLHLLLSGNYNEPLNATAGHTVVNFMTDFAVENQNGYILMLIGIVFCCGITFSTLSLGISPWVKNEFLTLLIPFALCILVAMITPAFDWDLLLLYSPSGYVDVPIRNLVIMGGTLFVVGIVLFVTGVIFNERKADESK